LESTKIRQQGTANFSRRENAMNFSAETQIHRIGQGVMDLSLPKAAWTHAAHFAAALWLLRYRPEINAPLAMPDLIRAYNEAAGVANTDSGGYHETITQASLRAARAFLARQPATMPVFEITNALMQSSLGKPDWLLEYWSRTLLFSPQARRAWREPDIKPLPY
jgi:hypothetical protein